MNLDKVLEIANECVENENIPIEGLTLMYKLDRDTHKKLDEELFYIQTIISQTLCTMNLLR